VAIGLQALFNNTAGSSNVASGNNALSENDTGDTNVAIGFSALTSNTGGSGNIAIGFSALPSNTTGNENTVIGNFAATGVGGNQNTILGAGAGLGIGPANNVICIGANVAGQSLGNSCYIGNIFGATSSTGIAVLVNADGKLGTTTSSRRFKEQIKPMDAASEVLFSLKPVAFRYKQEIDPAGISQFGLVAEDVERLNPDLVVRDREGNPYSVRYDQVNAMLLNEFLKEHKAFVTEQRKVEEQEHRIQEQEVTITELQKEVLALVAHAKDQDSRIQRVCAKLESAVGAQLVSVP
jgi:hypothetical protein